MYPTLIAELARRGIKQKDVTALLGISIGSLYRKLHGRSPWLLEEALKLHRELFSDTDFMALFARADNA